MSHLRGALSLHTPLLPIPTLLLCTLSLHLVLVPMLDHMPLNDKSSVGIYAVWRRGLSRTCAFKDKTVWITKTNWKFLQWKIFEWGGWVSVFSEKKKKNIKLLHVYTLAIIWIRNQAVNQAYQSSRLSTSGILLWKSPPQKEPFVGTLRWKENLFYQEINPLASATQTISLGFLREYGHTLIFKALESVHKTHCENTQGS